MKTTGTNQIQDLWQDIQFIKRISSHTISETSKRRIIYKYNLYKQLGGERTDEQIEKWKEEVK
jgi:hypothetical protein